MFLHIQGIDMYYAQPCFDIFLESMQCSFGRRCFGRLGSILGAGEALLGGEGELGEPVEQLLAVGADHVDLRKVYVAVDHTCASSGHLLAFGRVGVCLEVHFLTFGKLLVRTSKSVCFVLLTGHNEVFGTVLDLKRLAKGKQCLRSTSAMQDLSILHNKNAVFEKLVGFFYFAALQCITAIRQCCHQ